MEARIYTSISHLPAGKWDSIAGPQVACSHAYLSLLEKSGLNPGRSYYVTVENEDKVLAHTCAYLMSAGLDVFARGPLKKLILLLRRAWKDFLIIKYLECGSPVTTANPVSVRPGVDTARVLGCLCGAVEELAAKLGVKVVLLRDFCDDETGFGGVFAGRGYGKIHNLPKAELEVRWKSFDAYLDAMRSNYRRKIVKRIEKCAEAVHVTVRPLRELPDGCWQELARLYENILRNTKEVSRAGLPAAFFRDMASYLGDRAAIVIAQKSTRIVGFMLLLKCGEELSASSMGLDYEHSEEHFIYFNLFYAAIRYGIEQGFRKVCLSITTLDPKRDMGARITGLNMFLRHRNGVFTRVLDTLFDMITAPDTSIPRDVFK
jgi:predicted N-acyltransferase